MAAHILTPPLECDSEFRFTVANDKTLQHRWAEEHGVRTKNLEQILALQIEDHKAEVVYSLDPVRFDSSFIRALPSCVKVAICWLAAPQFGADLSAYSLRVCNFPGILEDWRTKGLSGAWLTPAHDPEMNLYAQNRERPIDVSFVGQYSWLHRQRNKVLEELAELRHTHLISLRLMCPRWKRLGNRRFLNRISLPIPYLPKQLQTVCGPVVFGRDMYALFAQSKIVFNAAIDMSGTHRGNMRCFEALGCGAAMLSDRGMYSDGFTPGTHFDTFNDGSDVITKIKKWLAAPTDVELMARRGFEFVKNNFTQEKQWRMFKQLASSAEQIKRC